MARREIIAADEEATSDEMVDIICDFYDDPLAYVIFAFPWGEEGTDLQNEPGPDAWQIEVLETLAAEVKKRDRDDVEMGAILMAAASGHGPGKTALVAWIILWFNSTRSDPMTVVTANTLGQLSGKTWRELAKWHRRAINGSWFQWTATTFYLKDRPETHKANAVPWTKERSQAFAGAHGAHVLIIFDEASTIDDEIWTVTEGAMTTAGAIWMVFGNPTKNTGRFRECWRQFRHRWLTFKVDARTARKTNKAQIAAWIQDYGEDSDFVRVRVTGDFPRAASTQLIPEDLVTAAQNEWKRRVPTERLRRAIAEGPHSVGRLSTIDLNPIAPRILICDVARFGNDQTVFGLRIGKTFVSLQKFRGLDTMQIAARFIEWIEGIGPDAIIVDGGGVGGGVVDQLTTQGYEVISYMGGLKALDERKCANRRSETWLRAKMWLAAGGAVDPDDKEIFDDLTGPEYMFDKKWRLQLETKEDMTARGLPSPDTGDTLAMSFCVDVAPRALAEVNSVAAKLLKAANGQVRGATTWMSM